MKIDTASLLIHPEEFNPKWIDRCVDLKIPTLALHPVGGFRSPLTMKAMLDRLETPEYRKLIDEDLSPGMEIKGSEQCQSESRIYISSLCNVVSRLN